MSETYTIITSNGGHSYKAPGASADGFKEHEQTRLCNKAFIKAMKKRGVAVIDTTSDAKNKYAVLQEQVAKANRVNGGKKQLDLSFHLNASDGKGHGTEVYYYSDDAKPLAAALSRAISKKLGLTDRGAKQGKDLYFLRKTKATALLVEVCFIDNPDDMRALVKKREVAMEAVADVVAARMKPLSTDSSTSSTDVSSSSYTGNSLVDYLKSGRVDASFSHRADLAASCGIVKKSSAYRGTAEQNAALLKALRKEEGR